MVSGSPAVGRRGLPSRPSQDLGAQGYKVGSGGNRGREQGGARREYGELTNGSGNGRAMEEENVMGRGGREQVNEYGERQSPRPAMGLGISERGDSRSLMLGRERRDLRPPLAPMDKQVSRPRMTSTERQDSRTRISTERQESRPRMASTERQESRPRMATADRQDARPRMTTPDRQESRPKMATASTQDASSRTILEGYRGEITGDFRQEKARFNPMNTSRPQGSALFNVNDPIQVHLLVETALGDSKEYEILSQEEVDDLKKQCRAFTQRIEQTRQNLAIQSKYRDAAASMTKLYSTSDRKKNAEDPESRKPRLSFLGHRKNSSASEADLERLTSERKCEELAAELWSLEKRLMVPQSRLLKHTAGILQMTHKGPKKKAKSSGIPQHDGVPGSPESIFTYSNARSSLEPVMLENHFDDRSLYMAVDGLGAFDDPYGNRGIGGVGEGVKPPPKSLAREQLQMIAKTEQRLEDLSSRLREVITKVNPAQSAAYGSPPRSKANGAGRSADPGETIQGHLDYLEKSIDTMDREQGKASKSEETLEQTVEEVNRELYDLLLPYDASRPSPPRLDGNGLDRQLRYFQDSIGAVEMELSRAASNTSKSSSNQGNVEQMETVITGLWEIIQSGEQEMKRRKIERRQEQFAKGLNPDDDDSALEDNDTDEPFTLQAFSAKVQALSARIVGLKDEKKVLQRQVKQQRELNNKSDATKDAEILQKVKELGRMESLLARTENDADAVREQLGRVMEKLDEMRQKEQLREQARTTDESTAVRAAQAELDEKKKMITALEERNRADDRKRMELEDRNRAAFDERAKVMAELEERNRFIADLQIRNKAALDERNKTALDERKQVMAELAERNKFIAELQVRSKAALDEGNQNALNERKKIMAELEARKKVIAELEERSKGFADLEERNTVIANLEEELQELRDDQSISNAETQGKLAESEAKIASLKAQIASIEGDTSRSDALVKTHEAQIKAKEDEMEEMNMKIAELQTEVTIARAELDGAYGSRAQRAAEATNPAVQKELANLTQKNLALTTELAALKESGGGGVGGADGAKMKLLKRELEETIEEYEQMTKASVEWEKEREELEAQVDRLREERSALEASLSDEKLRWLGMKSPGVGGDAAGGGAGATSTTVLKNEFKKMMRDTRAESLKVLKAEQAERRKVEDELRALKKSLGRGGKSSLN